MNLPEHTHLDRRIARAYERYMRAKGEWADAWKAIYIASESAQKAVKAVKEVRRNAR